MKKIIFLLNAFLLFAYLGCASSNYHTYKNNTSRSYYTSAFPQKNISAELEYIQRSVQRIICTGVYTTYYFAEPNITLADVHQYELPTLASRKSTSEKSKAGTAISILQNNKYTALITARHVSTFADTLIAYREGKNIPEKKYIESVSVKKEEHLYLLINNKISEIHILASDTIHDLALIKSNRSENDIDIPPLPIKFGRAKDLKLASFLYILGYPLGSPMITRGIVSAPNYDGVGSFLTDALFNHGISGGLIIASRNHYNNFEWVGMAVSASAYDQQFLIPDPSKGRIYNDQEAYTDTAFVAKRKIINYGITIPTPIEQIMGFITLNENKLNRLGLSVKELLR